MKILTTAAIAMATSAAFAFTLWEGDTEKVNTGLDNETKTAGYWFDYNDNKDGGLSKLTWDVAIGTPDDERSLLPVVDHCHGICGNITLSVGTLTYNPFIGVGFNVVGETSLTDPTPLATDATEWKGLCIAYASTLASVLEMGLGDVEDEAIGWNNPVADLPKSSEGTVKEYLWADFRQGWAGDVDMDGATAATKLVAIKVKFQGEDGLSGTFHISQIGPWGSGCTYVPKPEPVPPPEPGDQGIKGARSASSVKALVSGRTLSFSGIPSAASVEVINLQGRVVKKASVKGAASLDLSAIDAGVYMVRVSGKSVDYSNKIVLK